MSNEKPNCPAEMLIASNESTLEKDSSIFFLFFPLFCSSLVFFWLQLFVYPFIFYFFGGMVFVGFKMVQVLLLVLLRTCRVYCFHHVLSCHFLLICICFWILTLQSSFVLRGGSECGFFCWRQFLTEIGGTEPTKKEAERSSSQIFDPHNRLQDTKTPSLSWVINDKLFGSVGG